MLLTRLREAGGDVAGPRGSSPPASVSSAHEQYDLPDRKPRGARESRSRVPAPGLAVTLTRFPEFIPHAERLSRVRDGQDGEGAPLRSGRSSGERKPTRAIGRNRDGVRGGPLGRRTTTHRKRGYARTLLRASAESLGAGRGRGVGARRRAGCWWRARVAARPRATPGTGAAQAGARLHAAPAFGRVSNIYQRWRNTKMLI